jgi:hypothetical protein
MINYSRSNDRYAQPDKAASPEVNSLEGTWFNADLLTGEIRKVVLSIRNGDVVVRAFGADGAATVDWGEAQATPYVDRLGSTQVTGFFAEYDLGFVRTRMATNVKYGVLVIQSYNEFTDGSGRASYFTREFFSREVVHQHALLPSDVACVALSDLVQVEIPEGAVDLAHFVGHWTNTKAETAAITHFDLRQDSGRFYLRARGAGHPGDWGEVEVTPHAYDATSRRGVAFLARYAFDFAEITLAVNENKGLIIIASYHRFKDSSPRSNYFKREFFYRDEAVRK